MQILENYTWHGNVRELEHTIERAVALERTDEIQPERLPEHITNYNPDAHQSRIRFAGRRHQSRHASGKSGKNLCRRSSATELRGNQTRAAELLQMPVRSLRHLLDKHRIRTLSAQMRGSGE